MEAQKLKLNVTNIKSFLVTKNAEQAQLRQRKNQEETRKKQKIRLQEKEKRLELSGIGSSVKSVGSTIAKAPMNIFDKILGFGSLILAGILVNNLPGIAKKVKEMYDGFVEVIQPVVSGIKLVIGMMSGDLDNPELDPDKKRFKEALDGVTADGGLMDQIKEKLGPFGDIVDALKPIIDTFSGLLTRAMRANNIVLAKQGGKEGVLNKETGDFTESTWTNEQRIKFRRREALLRYDKYSEDKRKAGKYKQGDIIRGENDKLYQYDAVSGTFIPYEMPDEGDQINYDNTGRIRDAHSAGNHGRRWGGTPVEYQPGSGVGQEIYLHWSGGSYTSVPDAYNTVVTGDGDVKYVHEYTKSGLAHTWRRNSRGVGLAIAAMGVKSGKWNERRAWKDYPPTKKQYKSLINEAARLAISWGWEKSEIDRKVITHAEAALQDGYGPGSGDAEMRWDFHYLDPNRKSEKGGKILRDRIKKRFQQIKDGQSNTTTVASISPVNEPPNTHLVKHTTGTGSGDGSIVVVNRTTFVEV